MEGYRYSNASLTSKPSMKSNMGGPATLSDEGYRGPLPPPEFGPVGGGGGGLELSRDGVGRPAYPGFGPVDEGVWATYGGGFLGYRRERVPASGLCECATKPVEALCGCFCPCVIWGQTMEHLRTGSSSNLCSCECWSYFCCCYCCTPLLVTCFSCWSQQAVDQARVNGGLSDQTEPKHCFVVALKSIFCTCCSLVQDYLDIKKGLVPVGGDIA